MTAPSHHSRVMANNITVKPLERQGQRERGEVLEVPWTSYHTL